MIKFQGLIFQNTAHRLKSSPEVQGIPKGKKTQKTNPPMKQIRNDPASIKVSNSVKIFLSFYLVSHPRKLIKNLFHEDKSSWNRIHWEGAHNGNLKPKNPNPNPHNPIPLMGHDLPFSSSKTQTEAPLRKTLKNMKIAGSIVSKQLFTLQIVIYIEVQPISAQSPNLA